VKIKGGRQATLLSAIPIRSAAASLGLSRHWSEKLTHHKIDAVEQFSNGLALEELIAAIATGIIGGG